mgnify:CR=1 FL=1
MNLLAGFLNKIRLKNINLAPSFSGRDGITSGFSMMEVLLVVGAIIFIASLSFPVGLRFFQTQSLDETRSAIVANLRRAAIQAIFQKNDSDFGVRILPDTLILFQGPSYIARLTTEDEILPIQNNIVIAGINEIVFSKVTGIPSATGTIILAIGSEARTITINDEGIIE